MKSLMISLFAIATLVLGACGGSMSANAEANSASGQMDAKGAWGDVGNQNYAEQEPAPMATNTNELGESMETGPIIFAQPATSNHALPAECRGVMPAPQKLAEGTLICRCVSGRREAVWSTFVWDKEAYPNCKTPTPNEVLSREITQPFGFPGSNDDPYKVPAPAAAKVKSTATTEAAATATAATSSRTQVTCSTKMNGESRIAVCQVARDNQPAQEFTCIGPKVRDLTAKQKSTYDGGAPCTCEDGSPKPVGAAMPNTWQCK